MVHPCALGKWKLSKSTNSWNDCMNDRKYKTKPTRTISSKIKKIKKLQQGNKLWYCQKKNFQKVNLFAHTSRVGWHFTSTLVIYSFPNILLNKIKKDSKLASFNPKSQNENKRTSYAKQHNEIKTMWNIYSLDS